MKSSQSASVADDGDLSFSPSTSVHPGPLVYPPLGKHTHTFIILHGRGGNAQAFGPEFMHAEHSSGITLQQLLPNMKFIFPTAKRRRMAAQNRCTITQWFDIISLEDPMKREDVQVEGLRESCACVHQMIENEMRHVPCENIVLGGLSQGCATALYALLTFEPPQSISSTSTCPIGAIMGMSGWMPFRNHVDEILCETKGSSDEDDPFDRVDDLESLSANAKAIQALNVLRENIDLCSLSTLQPLALQTPVFLGHGTADDKVNVQLGEEAAATLRELGMDVTWKPYKDFYHWYKEPDEIDDIVLFLQQKLRL